MEITETIEFIYSWQDEQGTKQISSFKKTWDGLTRNAPHGSELHDTLASFLTCVGITPENIEESK